MSGQSLPSAAARVALASPRRYLAQLCKHFAHRLPVTLTEADGRIDFQGGTCKLTAETSTLVLHLTADDETALEKLEDVVARHLARFAFRDPPAIAWTRAP